MANNLTNSIELNGRPKHLSTAWQPPRNETALAQGTRMAAHSSNREANSAYRRSLRSSICLVTSARPKSTSNPLPPRQRRTVSQNELYAALLHQNLSSLKPELAQRFAVQFKRTLHSSHASNPERAVFSSATQTLRRFLQAGELSRKEFNAVRAYALGKARLDGKCEDLAAALAGNPSKTAPKMEIGAAIEKSLGHLPANQDEVRAFHTRNTKILRTERQTANHTSHKARPAAQAVSSTAAGGAHASTGPAHFLWKPISESNGNLVILLPASLSGQVESVEVLSPDGKVLATGRYTGRFSDGRPIFRFDRPGASFQPGCSVQITGAGGAVQRIAISDPAGRVVISMAK